MVDPAFGRRSLDGMSTMLRTLRQPGPPAARRIEAVRGALTRLRFPVHAGLTLAEALTRPLVEAGLQSATIRLDELALGPFRYVMPAPAPDDSHVAYFSRTHEPPGVSHVEIACATFGWTDGKPVIHCHAVWQEADGRRRGGHILTDQTVVAAPTEARTAGLATVRIETHPDPETNFPLLRPSGTDCPGDGIVARVAPNQDILAAMESVAEQYGVRDAVVRGTLGSLVGAQFADGTVVEDDATEVLVRAGRVRDGRAELDVMAVDMRGEVHEGWLAHGRNAVCITFDLMLDTASEPAAPRRVV